MYWLVCVCAKDQILTDARIFNIWGPVADHTLSEALTTWGSFEIGITSPMHVKSLGSLPLGTKLIKRRAGEF